MKTFTFYGSGDDVVVFEESGKSGDEAYLRYKVEFSDEHSTPSKHSAVKFEIDRRLVVYAVYAGTWGFFVNMIEEGDELDDFMIQIEREHDYSLRLKVVTKSNDAKLVVCEPNKARAKAHEIYNKLEDDVKRELSCLFE